MEDRVLVYPVFELAMELGITNIAVHKALPLGPVATEAYRVDDVGYAASEFPDINFQIVHAGLYVRGRSQVPPPELPEHLRHP